MKNIPPPEKKKRKKDGFPKVIRGGLVAFCECFRVKISCVEDFWRELLKEIFELVSIS
jgi:hypothetical protein